MTSASDPSSDASGSPAAPLIDSPVEGLIEWDSPFCYSFVPGSEWAPWLATAKFPPPGDPAPARGGMAAPTVRPPPSGARCE